jgi:hypothetical protein
MAAPTIDSNTPTGTILDADTTIDFSTKDDTQVEQTSINCTVNDIDAIINGVFQTGWDGAGSSISANAFNGYDVVIEPTSDLALAKYNVLASCEDTGGAPASLPWYFIVYDFAQPRDRRDYIGIGVPPFMISITNPRSGILIVEFVEEMENDVALNSATSYEAIPIGDSPPIHFTNATRLTGVTVQLSFVGGGSPYILTITGLMDIAGNYADPRSLPFELEWPSVDELATGDRIFFDTDLGSVELLVHSLSRRRIEDLTIQRAKNLGTSAQLSLISKALKDSGINYDEQKLKLFKG